MKATKKLVIYKMDSLADGGGMENGMRGPYAVSALSKTNGRCSSGDRLNFRGEELHPYSPCCVILAKATIIAREPLESWAYSCSIQQQTRKW